MQMDESAKSSHAFPLPDRELKRNSCILVANGATMFAAFTLASSDLVLPAFVQTLTTSSILVSPCC